RTHVLILLGLILVAGVGIWTARSLYLVRHDTWNRDLLQRLLGQFRFAGSPLVPSHWMTLGIQKAARVDTGEAMKRLGPLWVNGLMLYVVTAWPARNLYRRGYNRVATGGELRRRYGGGWLDRTLARSLGFLDPQTRLLIVKDFQTFRRDPVQWAQILIF